MQGGVIGFASVRQDVLTESEKSILSGHHSTLRSFNIAWLETILWLWLLEIDILQLFRCFSTGKRAIAGILVVTLSFQKHLMASKR